MSDFSRHCSKSVTKVIAGGEQRLPYAEDGVGLTWRLGVALVAPVAVGVLVVLTAPVSVSSAIIGALTAVEIVLLALAWGAWTRGIRVTTTEVRIGGCRDDDRRRARVLPPRRVRLPQLRGHGVFAVPMDATRAARVVEHAQLRQLDADPESVELRQRRRRSMGDLRLPFANAVLELRVDLARATVPAMPTRTFEQLGVYRTSQRWVQTDRWLVPTRRPSERRAALAEAGHFGGSASFSLPQNDNSPPK